MQRNVETKERINPPCSISARLPLCSIADSRIKTESFISVHNWGDKPTVNSDGQLSLSVTGFRGEGLKKLILKPVGHDAAAAAAAALFTESL